MKCYFYRTLYCFYLSADCQQGVVTNTFTKNRPNAEGNSTNSDTSTPTRPQDAIPAVSTQSYLMDTTNLSDVKNVSNTDLVFKPNPFVGGLIDKRKYERIIVITSYIGWCTSIFGTLGNAIALVVHTRMLKSSTRTYLIGVTILDSLYLLCTITPFTLTILLEGHTLTNRLYLYYAAYVSNTIIPCLRRTIICVTMMLSVERLLAIAFPLKARHFRIIKQPITFIVVTFVLVVALQSYNFNKHNVIESVDPSTNQTVHALVRTEFYNTNEDVLSIINFISTGLTVYVPLLIVTIANICLVLVLQRCVCTFESRSHDVPSQFFALERQKSVAILTYTCLFVLLALPYALHAILSGLVGEFNPGKKQHYLYFTMLQLYGIFDAASSSMNFLVYVSISNTFRSQLKLVLGIRQSLTYTPKPPRRCRDAG